MLVRSVDASQLSKRSQYLASRKLLLLYAKAAVGDAMAEVSSYLNMALFTSICCRGRSGLPKVPGRLSFVLQVFGQRRGTAHDDPVGTRVLHHPFRLKSDASKIAMRRSVIKDIRTFRTEAKSQGLDAPSSDAEKVAGFAHISYVLEVEQICVLKEWTELQNIIQVGS